MLRSYSKLVLAACSITLLTGMVLAGCGSSQGPAQPALTFAAVSAGGFDFSCGITTTNATYCWGDNADGQLGDGTTTNRTTPVAVGGVLLAAVSAGGDHFT